MKIEVNALKEGMFVSDLDRPWHETPFPLQGFYIRVDDDVKALTDYCKHVFVDTKRQKSSGIYEEHATVEKPEQKVKANAQKTVDNMVKLPPLVIKAPQSYEVNTSIKKEISRSAKLHKHVYEAIDHVFSTIEQGGEISVKETETVAEGMVESVVRNPDALVWLSKMNDEDAHSYQHSVKSSIWALVFGRHLGLNKAMLKSLAMGVLLSKIGKTKLSADLLENEEQLSREQQIECQQYVQYSVDILEGLDGIPTGVSSIVEYHQERHNGTGFPKGVTGDRIPLLAKIAGLVDFYQDMITPREECLGLSPLDAVAKLYELRNIAFQQDLVERFIEAVGVYPTGTLVELSSQEVGIVTGHNADRRLLPKIIVVLDEHKQPLKCGKVIDLKEQSESKRKARASHQALYIKDSLPKGAYDIDENQYLLTGATSRWSWRHITGSLAAG